MEEPVIQSNGVIKKEEAKAEDEEEPDRKMTDESMPVLELI